ncbi:hypothetical protein MMPV_004067 [Pyropia vietnamensis]
MSPPPQFSTYPIISMDEAVDRLRSSLAPLPPVTLPLAAALHHTLVSPIVAPAPQPPFPASTRDGYAVASADGPGTWRVSSRVAAGAAEPPPTLPRGTVAYITTGAEVPPGADAVVMVEDVEFVTGAASGNGDGDGDGDGDGNPDAVAAVVVKAAVAAGTHIRPVGSDVAVGEVLVPAGARLTPGAIGVAAAAGVATVTVTRMPVVGVLSTGNELVDLADTPHAPSAVIDANRPTLLAALATAVPACSTSAAAEAVAAGSGGVLDLGIVPDEAGAVAAAVAAAIGRVDVLLTSGGVSMGDADHVKPALAAAGRVVWGRLAIKPGKPLTFATFGRRDDNGAGDGPSPPRGDADDDASRPTQCAVGLPGNPASAFVGFHLVARTAIDLLSGGARCRPTTRGSDGRYRGGARGGARPGAAGAGACGRCLV